MSKKYPVRSLSDSALAELADLVVLSIGYALHVDPDRDISCLMIEIATYLDKIGATSNVYQDLLRVILISDYLEASIRFICLQMLLNERVQLLFTGVFPYSYYEQILQVIAEQGHGLRVLNLKGVWVRDEQMHYMYDIIRKCPNLTKLYIPYIANDELLEVIARYSANLKVIDVSGETDITEIGLESLSKGVLCHNLIVVDIGTLGEENICHSDIALILKNCPNIESLGTYSFVGMALKFVHDHDHVNFKCKLKYLHDTKTDDEQMEIIVRTCPYLEKIYLDSPKPGILHKLKRTNIRILKIYRFACEELMDVLDSLGRYLSSLTVIKGSGTFELGQLARMCLNLLELNCYVMEHLSYNNKYQFEFLNEFELLNSHISQSALKSFITHSTSLKRLAIDVAPFTDDDIIEIFTENNFNQLEDIWFSSAPNITFSSVEIIIDQCPELQSIGQLKGWSLSFDDLTILRAMLKSTNSSIVLSPSNLFN